MKGNIRMFLMRKYLVVIVFIFSSLISTACQKSPERPAALPAPAPVPKYITQSIVDEPITVPATNHIHYSFLVNNDQLYLETSEHGVEVAMIYKFF